MKIQPIVEGHGEMEAFSVLLRRLVQEAQVAALDIGRPIRRPRSKLVKEEEVQQAVRLALLQPDCGAVLILFDGDDDCPADLGPTVQNWATAAAEGTPDQPAFSALFSLPDAYRGSRSFRKLTDSFANLVRAMEHDVGVWPPSAWTDGT